MDTGPPDDERTIVRPPGGRGTLGHILPVGTRLRDFEITGLIGEGGFGIVYLADDRSLQRRVALKEYMPSSMAARVAGGITVAVKSERHQEAFAAGLRSFVNEARLLARFDHPSLVKVYRFWEEHGTAYMVMPYYEGQTLRAALAGRSAPPDEATLRAWLRPLLDALDEMHAAHCYHRDIAPDNILLTSTGPLLLDFGAARRVIGDLTHALTVVLKPGYAPIEQYGEVAAMAQGPWTDFYALASVVRFAITGRVPPSSVERLLDDRLEPLATCAAGRYSPRFLSAIDAALAVRPQDRPQTDAEFRALLDEPRAVADAPGGRFGPVSRPVAFDDAPAARSLPGAALRDGEASVGTQDVGAADDGAPVRTDALHAAKADGEPASRAARLAASAARGSNRKAAAFALLTAALALIATGAYLRFENDDDAPSAAPRREAATGSPGATASPAAPATATEPMPGGAPAAVSPTDGANASTTDRATASTMGGPAASTTEAVGASAAAQTTGGAPARAPIPDGAAVTPALPMATAPAAPPVPPSTTPAPARTAEAGTDTPRTAEPKPTPTDEATRRSAPTDARGRATLATPPGARAAERPDAARRTARAEAAKPAPTSEVAARCSDILQKASLEPLSPAEVAYLKRECR